MHRLAQMLMLVGAAFVSIGLVGRFALGDNGEAASGTSPAPASESPDPSEATGPSAETGSVPSEEPSESSEPSADPTPELAETPQEFFDLFVDAVQTQDDAFLLARLHPAVFEIYGRQQCRAAVASLEPMPGFDVTVRRVEGPEPYDYAPDDQSVTIDDAFTLALTFSSSAGTSRQEGHLALVGAEMRWFTDCGDPLA